MSALICNKCRTSNKEGADKCSTCGFPFSNNKMTTVGKYLGEFAPKPTILDAEVSGEIFSKPTSDAPSPIADVEPIFASDLSDNQYPMVDEQDIIIENPMISSNIIDVSLQNLSENNQELIENPIILNDLSSTLETERISQEKNTPEDPSEAHDHNCIKCGYILSDYSTICPSCGHNNVKASVTMRMPMNNDSPELSQRLSDKTIAEPNQLNATGAYPSISKQKDHSKTISEHEEKMKLSFETPYSKYDSKNTNNKTIREGYNENDENYNEEIPIRHPSQSEQSSKSLVRLEAIYLGQDSDQKMIINMPPHSNLLNITRSLVDEGDSTISSGIHATIYKEGEEWKIENKASNKAVFIQVNDTSNIKNGDIIMMGGDKFYVFVDESNK